MINNSLRRILILLPNIYGKKTTINSYCKDKKCQINKPHQDHKNTKEKEVTNTKHQFLKTIKSYYHHDAVKSIYSTSDQLMEYFFEVNCDIHKLNKTLGQFNKQLLYFRWKDEFTIAKYRLLRQHNKSKDYLYYLHPIIVRLDEVICQAAFYLKNNPDFHGKDLQEFVHQIKHVIKHYNLLVMDYMVLSHEELPIKSVENIVKEEKKEHIPMEKVKNHENHNNRVIPKKQIMKFIVKTTKSNFDFHYELMDMLEHSQQLTSENIHYILKELFKFEQSFRIPLNILRTLYKTDDSDEYKELEEMYKKFSNKWKQLLQKNRQLKEILENMKDKPSLHD